MGDNNEVDDSVPPKFSFILFRGRIRESRARCDSEMMGGEKTANEKRSTKLRAQLAAQFQSKIRSLLTTSLRCYLDSAAFGRSRTPN